MNMFIDLDIFGAPFMVITFSPADNRHADQLAILLTPGEILVQNWEWEWANRL